MLELCVFFQIDEFEHHTGTRIVTTQVEDLPHYHLEVSDALNARFPIIVELVEQLPLPN